MQVRKATQADIAEIEDIYARARVFMKENGNPNQWGNGYPSHENVLADLASGALYAVEDADGLCGVFTITEGEEPTYRKIDGHWLNDRPYLTLHRVAGKKRTEKDSSAAPAGRKTGIFASAVEYAKQFGLDIRVDTHELNLPMRAAIKKAGFTECGTVWVRDGSPRIAFHLPCAER